MISGWKAKELKSIELDVRDLNHWFGNNPEAVVIDIKYSVIQYTESHEGGTYVLVIYKEA